MEKQRFYLLAKAEDVNPLNQCLAELEHDNIEYEADYYTYGRNNVLVIVSFEN